MSKIPCEVVRDLFPSYIDQLTSEVTNNLVEKHMEECEECHQVYVTMNNPEAEPVDERNKEEIDFLKKTRNVNRRNIGIVIVVAIVFVLGILTARNYFFGTAVQNEYVACQLDVDGKELAINCVVADERFCISNVQFTEEDGIVKITCKSVRRSFFFNSNYQQTYIAEKDITEVHLGDRILWSKGETISAVTSAVYQTKHPYVGDMPANNETVNALNMKFTLGNFKNELQTTEQPYGWHFLIEKDVTNLSFVEKHMRSYAYVLLAVVENLGEVTYEYSCDGELMKMTITEESATEFAGQDIKSVGNNIVELQHLMEKAELIDMSYVIDYNQWNAGQKIGVEVVNLADDDIASTGITCYMDEDVAFTQAMSFADGTLIKKGDVISFELLPEDFTDERWKNVDSILFKITVTLENGETYECIEKSMLPMEFGYSYRYRLTGNEDEGYHINQ